MNHLHSPVPYKALKLEMTHACFAYDNDLFTPWLRPWEKEFFHNWFTPKQIWEELHIKIYRGI